MNKVEEKMRAVEEIAELMNKYTEYSDGVKDQPLTPEIREELGPGAR